MKLRTTFFILTSMLLLTNCNGKIKQPKEESLWDEIPEEFQQIQKDEKIQINIYFSPPPPGKADSRDTTTVIAPDKVSPSNKIYEITEVDYLPNYPNGGWESFTSYLQSIRYPKEVKDINNVGSLSILFVLEKDGSASNIQITSSVNNLIDNTIIEALKKMPAWKPAKKDGLYVRSEYSFTIIY